MGESMNAADLFAELGITQCPMTRYRRPGMPWTHCGAVVDRLISENGAPHARQVLMLFVQTKSNAGMMVRPMIQAVSDILLHHRRWRDAGSALLDSFDKISLSKIWETAKATRIKARREIICALLFVELERLLGPAVPPKPRPVKREPRLTLQERELPAVRRNIQLGCELLVRRAAINSNVDVGEMYREVGIDDTKLATECVRVARVYAERPDVTERVRWNVLVALCSPSLSEDQRQDFERRIIAGQKVQAKQIKLARGRLRNGRPKRGADQPARMAA
jgi:hypothetical protein